ncbi:MAG: NTP transferase domain-containing protein [Acidimicrobiia bacterium]
MSDRPPVAGIILAAGAALRMGEPKQLLLYRDKPLVQAVVDVAEASRLDEIVVVTGAYGDRVEAALRRGRATTVRNPDPTGGNMSSLEIGVGAAPDADAVVVLVGDQPGVDPEVVNGLINLWHGKRPWAAVTQYDDRVAYPFLLSDQALREAIEIGGPKLLWKLLAQDESPRVVRFRVATPAPLDVNTPEDFDRLTRRRP